MMIELTMLIGAIALLETLVILATFKDIKTAIKIMLGKKKGIKQIFFLRQDMTVERIAKKFEGIKLSVDGKDYVLNSKGLFFDRNAGVQCAIIKEGDQKMLNPFEKIKDTINPEMLTATLMSYYNLGRQETKMENEKLKKIIFIGMIAASAAAILSFLNMQALGDLAVAVASRGVNLG